MYDKSTRPSARARKIGARSATFKNSGKRSATIEYYGAWNATIKWRALGALKLASCARSARWECARQAGRFFYIIFIIIFLVHSCKLFMFFSLHFSRKNLLYIFTNLAIYTNFKVLQLQFFYIIFTTMFIGNSC